jgi:hypothetical protein
VTSIGRNAFRYCTSLYDVYFKSEIPPTVGTNVFWNVKFGARAIVPYGATGYGNEGDLWNGLVVTFADPIDLPVLSLRPASVTPAKLKRGDTFTLELFVENPAELKLASFSNINFGFDSDVFEWNLTGEYEQYENMPFAPGGLSGGLADPLNLPGSALNLIAPLPSMFTPSGTRFSFDSGESGNAATEGVLLTINLRVKRNAPSGISLFTLTMDELRDIGNNILPFELFPGGGIEVDTPRYGDIDGDGRILSNDVTFLRRYIAAPDKQDFINKNQSFNVANAHVRGKPCINAADVTLLRKYIASGNNDVLVPLGPQKEEPNSP